MIEKVFLNFEENYIYLCNVFKYNENNPHEGLPVLTLTLILNFQTRVYVLQVKSSNGSLFTTPKVNVGNDKTSANKIGNRLISYYKVSKDFV